MKNSLWSTVAFVSAIAAAQPVCAATWVSIADASGVEVFVDVDSIRVTGPQVRTWLKWEWEKPFELKHLVPVRSYKLEKQLQVSNCVDRTLAISQGTRYAELDGKDVVESYSIPKLEFTEAVPESIGESIIKFACTNRSRPAKKR